MCLSGRALEDEFVVGRPSRISENPAGTFGDLKGAKCTRQPET